MPHVNVRTPPMQPISHPSHYKILNLSGPNFSSTAPPAQSVKATLKTAYRAALLRHHPDKAAVVKSNTGATSSPPQDQSRQTSNVPQYTIDQIARAYAVLSDPEQRIEYDRALLLQSSAPTSNTTHNVAIGDGHAEVFHTGIETIDLDDLSYDTTMELWYRDCRCGDEKGFLLREKDLEEAAGAALSEVLVDCRGCSLWLKVLFGVVGD